MKEIRVAALHRAPEDQWSTQGQKFSSTGSLTTLRSTLETKGSVIIEHWHYRGSRAPERRIFDDIEDLLEYLRAETRAGDIIDAWSMHEVCKPENRLLSGKMPDPEGRVPAKGAY